MWHIVERMLALKGDEIGPESGYDTMSYQPHYNFGWAMQPSWTSNLSVVKLRLFRKSGVIM